MHKRKSESNYVLFDSLNNKNGSRVARKFFDQTTRQCISYLKDFYNDVSKVAAEHGFHHGEQHLKSYITSALNKVTHSSFMQEYSITRKHKNKKASNGRVDYWANFRSCSFLIEVKHDWIRLFPDTKQITFYKSLEDKLKAAIDQINKIEDKPEFNYRGNLYGLGLLVAPVFVKRDKILRANLNRNLIKELMDNSKKIGANIMACWKIENKYLFLNEYEPESGKVINDYYPALCFIGKFKKISRDPAVAI